MEKGGRLKAGHVWLTMKEIQRIAKLFIMVSFRICDARIQT